MEKIQDKIYDVYYSERNTKYRKNVRERIHWICRNATGNNILDIGCSQGITSILLGREGKKVFGLDLSDSAIAEATENLKKEETETQELVHFQKGNLMLTNFSEEYDCVVLGEVLEHINDIDSFFSKASSLVSQQGRIIVTTPFGINDFTDHKRTFYLNDFLNLQTDQLYISEIKFFGKWIGVIYQRMDNPQKKEVDSELLGEYENEIYKIERSLLDKQTQLQRENSRLIKELDVLKEEESNISIQNDIEDYKKKYLDEKVEKVKLQNELVKQYKKEEDILNRQMKLNRQYEVLQNQYNNLRSSKLGKLTVKYWRWRNKRGK